MLVGRDDSSSSSLRRAIATASAATVVTILAAAVHSGPAAAASGPSFVQQVSARRAGSTVTLSPGQVVVAGDRLVVQVGVWSAASATASAVSDSAGNSYTKLVAFTASDHTQMSVWTAPITAGGGTKPTVTVTASASADIGAVVSEYAGLSTAAGTGSLDQSKTATGTTAGSSATVASGATAAATAGPELALGLYVDSGFSDTLTAGSGWTQRANVSPTPDMELLSEDQLVAAGGTANATIGTGRNTPWLAATLVFKTG